MSEFPNYKCVKCGVVFHERECPSTNGMCTTCVGKYIQELEAIVATLPKIGRRKPHGRETT